MKREYGMQQLITDAITVSGATAFLDAAETVQKMRKECSQARFIRAILKSQKHPGTRKHQRYIANLMQVSSHCVLNWLEEDFLNRSKALNDYGRKKKR